MTQPHAWTPDSDGDCTICPLPESHPRHTSPEPEPAPALAPVADLGVRRNPEQPHTSQDAAMRAWPRAGTARARVLEAVAAAGEYGATDDELLFDLDDMSANTLRPRRGELVTAGWLMAATTDTGEPRTRPTSTGADATVWVLTPAARDRVDAA